MKKIHRIKIHDNQFCVAIPFSYINYRTEPGLPSYVYAKGHYSFEHGTILISGDHWGKDEYVYTFEFVFRGVQYYRAISGKRNGVDSGGFYTDIGLKRVAGRFGRECVERSLKPDDLSLIH